MKHEMITAFLTLAALTGCQGQGEYIPPLRSVGASIPTDLPVLGRDDLAAYRLIVNG